MPEPTPVKLTDFSVIKIAGQDAASFLHGQVTCDTNKYTSDNWLPGCHCNAKGKMWSTFVSFKRNDAIYLVMTNQSAQLSLAELNKYGVFANADITNDTDNWFIYGCDSAIDGAENIDLANEHYLVLTNQQIDSNEESKTWWQRELLSGRAHLYSATSGEYVPQMLNLQALDYISFNKGCYMGQEMVARMRYLGKNKRALFVAQGPSGLGLEIGQDVFIDLNGNRRSAGKVINFVDTGNDTTVQLVLKNDTDLATNIYLDDQNSQHLELKALPYSLEEN